MIEEREREYSDEELFSTLRRDLFPINNAVIQQARNGDGGILYGIGLEYMKIGQYSKALAYYLRSEAKNNRNKNAQFYIGALYNYGRGTPKNIHKAIEWYTKSAYQNHEEAQHNLALIYEEETEVKDLQKASNWYKKAADNSIRDAKIGVYRLYKQGYYPRDEETEMIEGLAVAIKTSTDVYRSVAGNMAKLVKAFRLRIESLQREQTKMKIQLCKKDREIKQLRKDLDQYEKASDNSLDNSAACYYPPGHNNNSNNI